MFHLVLVVNGLNIITYHNYYNTLVLKSRPLFCVHCLDSLSMNHLIETFISHA